MPHISIKAEPLFALAGFVVTNSLFTSWVVLFLLLLVALLYRRVKPVTHLVDMMLRALYGLFQPILHEKIHVFFPLVATFFIYIFALNWFGLLPGVGSVGIVKTEEARVSADAKAMADKGKNSDKKVEVKDEHDTLPKKEAKVVAPAKKEHAEEKEEPHTSLVHILRGGTADLNTTIALSIIAVVLIQFYGFKYLGFFGYIKKFVNLTNPINAFVGFLEIISELSKVISLAFRLFGNVFAGEVLLTVVSFLVPVLASLPFLMFEFFVGFMQALVFAMLTSIFLSVAITSHDEHDAAHH